MPNSTRTVGMTDYKVKRLTKQNMTSPSSHQRSVSRYQLDGKIHPIILYRWMARERDMFNKRETKSKTKTETETKS